MDNSTDFLLTNSSHAIRQQLIKDEKFILPPPVAEHGFSALIQIFKFDQSSSENRDKKFLFDTGVSENGVLHNADVFGIDIDKIDGIILSHGHFDHFAGLMNIIKRISSSSSSRLSNTNYVNIFAHPDAFLRRWEVMPDGKRAKCPILDELRIQESGAQIHKATGITILPSKESPLLLITGRYPEKQALRKAIHFNI